MLSDSRRVCIAIFLVVFIHRPVLVKLNVYAENQFDGKTAALRSKKYGFTTTIISSKSSS